MTNQIKWDQFKPTLSLKYRVREKINKLRYSNSEKIFCIGFNKTGTTSLKLTMKNLGFVVGNEYHAKFLFNSWVKRDWKPIIDYCKSAEFFQDSPFSLPHTFIPLDMAYPKSKFILTIRNDDEEWYNSLINFHGKLWGNGNIPPTIEDLKNANTGPYRGRPYHTIKNIFNVEESEPYKKDILTRTYNYHIENVKSYFRHRPEDLIVINLKNNQDYFKLCEFLDKTPVDNGFPWLNKT